jgi:hypothetical protein
MPIRGTDVILHIHRASYRRFTGGARCRNGPDSDSKLTAVTVGFGGFQL